MNHPRRFAGGFTLLELLVTLAIIAIAMQIAVPSMMTYQRNAELTSRANSMVALLSNARSEAMIRGVGTVVVPADGTSWSSGAISFVDVERNSTASSSNNVQLGIQTVAPSYLNTTGPGSFKFDPSGFSITNNGTLSIARNDVTGTELLQQTRKVIVANTGRVRACTPKSSTDANC